MLIKEPEVNSEVEMSEKIKCLKEDSEMVKSVLTDMAIESREKTLELIKAIFPEVCINKEAKAVDVING